MGERFQVLLKLQSVCRGTVVGIEYLVSTSSCPGCILHTHSDF
jgi:hypothetical protein